ncbi:MAG: hypothetical protein GKR89_01160 [Candidatus Latescibacteria bacterium]|nr:hypothetical protein [Candidatus Latescibacterota bacterium]
MAIAPPALYARLKKVFHLQPAASMALMQELIDECIDLVEEHLPQVDSRPFFADHEHINTTWARQKWRQRSADDPPYTLLERVGQGIAK